MSKFCGTGGGKGNLGMFIERTPTVCAAGVPSLQPTKNLSDNLKHYLMQEEVDALISDSIHPTEKPRKLPPLRHQPCLDKRNDGRFNQLYDIINPPIKTKFETLVQDFKETVYTSYWKKATGILPDPVPNLPQGFDVNTTLGKKPPSCDRLYDIVMPKDPLPDVHGSKLPSYQICRNYCTPPYNSAQVFGRTSNVDKRGFYAKCCLLDDDCLLGTNLKKHMSLRQVNFRQRTCNRLGESCAPNKNINNVPKEHTFGILNPPSDTVAECLSACKLNPEREFFKKCLAHLNSVRKFLAKRFEPTFFKTLYLDLKFLDKDNTGWLSKDIIYKHCSTKLIVVDPVFIEPLLSMWNAFNGSLIKYELFIVVLNFTQLPPTMPKVLDVPKDCIDFRTTYTEMVNPKQQVDKRGRAGLPSGRYIDKDYPIIPQGCCKADIAYMPQESDAKACLSPSIMTLFGVNHRDMFAKREPQKLRQVFEAAGEKFNDEEFNVFWENAKKYHSLGWVSFETFRRSINEIKSRNEKQAA